MAGLRRRLRIIATGVTPAGRAALLLAVGGLLLGQYAGYTEFRLLAAVLGLLFVVSLLFTALPTMVDAELDLTPAHTVAGTSSRAVLRVTNLRRIRMFHPLVIVPVTGPTGVTHQRVPVRLPVLHTGERRHIAFEVPAPRRGVLQVGPVGARRTDPLGFFWRHASWTAPVELLVRPRIVSIESLGAGFVQDLEGTPSDQVSMSDLSFHALREYVRGDDLRHVHWRSSARTGQLHVRQYHDTRRTHAVVLIDAAASSYTDAEEFELALSIAASVVARAALDGHDLSLVCGPAQLTGSADSVLDALCRLEWSVREDEADLISATAAARSLTLASSQVIVVGGERLTGIRLQQVRAECVGDASVVGLRADYGGDETVRLANLLTISNLDHLPVALAAYAEQAIR